MNRILRTLFAALILALLAGCSTLSVNYDYDDNFDFVQYKTYMWMDRPNVAPANAQHALETSDLLDGRIRNSIAGELSARGMSESAENPDFLVVHHVGAKEKIQVTDWGYSYSNHYWGGYGNRQIDVYQFTEGTLIIDIVDASSKALVWRGSGTGVVEKARPTPEKQQAKLNEVVFKIMKSFPPQGK